MDGATEKLKRDDAFIETHNSIAYYPFSPNSFDINLDDIAWALSLLCRFTGHCSDFYSVAQHSVYVSRITNSKWGLLHDAAEAYIADISRPVKMFLQNYKDLEEINLHAIARAFNLDYPMPNEIKVADNIVLATEHRDLFSNKTGLGEKWILPEEPAVWRVYPWIHERAYAEFLRRAKELGI